MLQREDHVVPLNVTPSRAYLDSKLPVRGSFSRQYPVEFGFRYELSRSGRVSGGIVCRGGPGIQVRITAVHGRG